MVSRNFFGKVRGKLEGRNKSYQTDITESVMNLPESYHPANHLDKLAIVLAMLAV